jgi:chromosome segregation ATPase
MKAATIILVIIALGLGGALFYRHTQAVKIQRENQDEIAKLSKSLEETKTKLDDQERIAMILRTNLTLTSQELDAISNTYVKVTADLRRTQADAKAAAEAAKAAEEASKAELAKKDSQINQLQSQGDELNKKISGLDTALGNLNKQIADTESKLAAAEGDREFLLKELKRMQAEKAELERQFNDLALLRTQVAKLKEELSVSRRLEWIRMGIYGAAANKKGAELLMSGINPPEPRSNYNLNVELRQDGGATIVPPQTNAPPK